MPSLEGCAVLAPVDAAPNPDSADFRALQRGEEAALNRLIARWERRLFGFAWRYLHNRADAQDLVVEVFVRLHQSRARLRPDTNLSAWLFTTLANLCHNQHRWRLRHPSVSLAMWDHRALAAETPSPEETLEDREALEALAAAIARLPTDLKTTLLLHHYEGLSYREIAGITGCSERGIDTRLYRARARLREALGEFRKNSVQP